MHPTLVKSCCVTVLPSALHVAETAVLGRQPGWMSDTMESSITPVVFEHLLKPSAGTAGMVEGFVPQVVIAVPLEQPETDREATRRSHRQSGILRCGECKLMRMSVLTGWKNDHIADLSSIIARGAAVLPNCGARKNQTCDGEHCPG